MIYGTDSKTYFANKYCTSRVSTFSQRKHYTLVRSTQHIFSHNDYSFWNVAWYL